MLNPKAIQIIITIITVVIGVIGLLAIVAGLNTDNMLAVWVGAGCLSFGGLITLWKHRQG